LGFGQGSHPNHLALQKVLQKGKRKRSGRGQVGLKDFQGPNPNL